MNELGKKIQINKNKIKNYNIWETRVILMNKRVKLEKN
jgi:hypothetical protein